MRIKVKEVWEQDGDIYNIKFMARGACIQEYIVENTDEGVLMAVRFGTRHNMDYLGNNEWMMPITFTTKMKQLYLVR